MIREIDDAERKRLYRLGNVLDLDCRLIIARAAALSWPSGVDIGESVSVPGGSEAAWLAWALAAPLIALRRADKILFNITKEVHRGTDVGSPDGWWNVSQQHRVREDELDRQWLIDAGDHIEKKRNRLLEDLSDMRWPRIHVSHKRWLKGEAEWRQAIADAHGNPGSRHCYGDLSGGLDRFIQAVEDFRRSRAVRAAANRVERPDVPHIQRDLLGGIDGAAGIKLIIST